MSKNIYYKLTTLNLSILKLIFLDTTSIKIPSLISFRLVAYFSEGDFNLTQKKY